VSLTLGPGPFSDHRAGLLIAGDLPRNATYAMPYPRRVRAILRGQVVLDSTDGWMLQAPPGTAPRCGSLPTTSTRPRCPPPQCTTSLQAKIRSQQPCLGSDH
jgi:hypothetical protein